jgi:hypothetical protein
MNEVVNEFTLGSWVRMLITHEVSALARCQRVIKIN